MNKIKDKEEKIDINCMLHKCKRCPKQKECEENSSKEKKNNEKVNNANMDN